MTDFNIHTGNAETQTINKEDNPNLDSTGETEISGKGSVAIHKSNISEGTMGAGEETQWRSGKSLIDEKPLGHGELDKALLARAESIIDSFDSDDVVESMINLEALRGIVLGLWKRAKNSSYYHQDILSTLENALLSKNDFTEEDMELFHETIQDLKNEHLVENHVKIISERFIYQDFSPLAFLSEIKDEDSDK
jgi:hypothetical protein